MYEVMLMVHAGFGLLVILGSVWVFVDVLNVNQSNLERIRGMSLFVAIAMWVTFIIAGYWYVNFYGPEKAHILKGPWPFAHDFYMETKEHIVLMVLLLATFLPIAARDDLVGNRSARNIALTVAGLIAIVAVLVEGGGGIISMGVKMALLPK